MAPGASGAISCPALSGAGEAGAATGDTNLIERCALELGPSRGVYTTRESVEDIEAIRQATGYEKLVLYGTSYGTKVALEYAERYPQHVEALVLDSPETPEGPEPFHVSTFKAIKPALRELCSRGACAGVTRNPTGDLARLAARLHSRPLTGESFAGNGTRVRVSVTAGDLFELLLAGDLDPLRARRTARGRALGPQPRPGAVDAHDRARRSPTLAASGPGQQRDRQHPVRHHLLRGDAVPVAAGRRPADPGTRSRSGAERPARLGLLSVRPGSRALDQTIPLCIAWPDASPAPPAQSALPDVPTLILSGGQDLRTPTANARDVAALIPDVQILKVPYTGHSVIGSDFSGCAQAAVAAFFSGASPTAMRDDHRSVPAHPACADAACRDRPRARSERRRRSHAGGDGSTPWSTSGG